MTSDKQVGRFRLLGKIGVGGMAEIFKAEESLPDNKKRIVAVKRLLPRLSAEREFVGMFVNEARIASSMSHPNIVKVYDMLNLGSYYYIIMEYLDGLDLEDLIQQTGYGAMALPLEEIAYIIHEVARGLFYAHRGGFHQDSGPVIHRDISPGNILVDTRGMIKITDFGIARALQAASFTQPGVLKGKYEYMAPEYVEGKTIDGRSDLFSLGVVLYELLTGESPFAAVLPNDIWERIVNLEPVEPSSLAGSIPKAMDAVAVKALSKNPKKRYQNGQEMAQQLNPLFDRVRVSASLGRKVAKILGKRKQPVITQSDIDSFLPPRTPGVDPTEQMYLDDLLDLVEPVSSTLAVFNVKDLEKTVTNWPSARGKLKSVFWNKRLLASLLAACSLLLAASLVWLLWPQNEKGYLWVGSDLKAEVFVDERRIGLAPLGAYPLSPGTHTIMVRRIGNRDIRKFVRTIVAEEHTRIRVDWPDPKKPKPQKKKIRSKRKPRKR